MYAGCVHAGTQTYAWTYQPWPKLGRGPMIPPPPRKRQGTNGNDHAVYALKFSTREYTVSSHALYFFYSTISNYIIIISLIVTEVPGTELSMHPFTTQLSGNQLWPYFHMDSGLGYGSPGFTETAQSSALSISHRNMPGLVSEPAPLRTWPGAFASPSPAMQHAKTSHYRLSE